MVCQNLLMEKTTDGIDYGPVLGVVSYGLGHKKLYNQGFCDVGCCLVSPIWSLVLETSASTQP